MVSWNTLLALCVLAFIIPFVLFAWQCRSLTQRAHRAETESRHLQRLLRSTEEQSYSDKALFLEALGVPFLLLRPSGRVVMSNKYARRLLSLENNDQLLKSLPEGGLRRAVEGAIAGAPDYEDTLRLDINGEKRVFRVTSTRIEHPTEHIGMVFNDMTEEERTQTIRRDFVANASHELRTPLTIIKGYIETLLEDPDTAENEALRMRSLRIMKKHADRIVRLVEDMLTVYRLENKEGPRLTMEEFDLGEVIDDTRLRLESMIRERGAVLDVSLQPNPFLMQGDKFYWSQIIFNLLENALKNNPQPGLLVCVQAQRDEQGTPNILVSDNGVGIPAASLPFIFNRFYRAAGGSGVRGTGLGLAIVRHAVEAHGLRISAASVPGRCTTFTIASPEH